jgi:hypothetical protein
MAKSQQTLSKSDARGEDVYASIMANHRPDKFGYGSQKLYIICACIFLCSMMNGEHTQTSALLTAVCNAQLRMQCLIDVLDRCTSKLYQVLWSLDQRECEHRYHLRHICGKSGQLYVRKTSDVN